MNRRKFLKRAGIGTGAVVATAAPIGAFLEGRDLGSKQLKGNYAASVVAGQRRGHANVWWSADTDRKVLAFTFDDGPTTQFTARVLDILDRYQVPASFFMVGANVDRHPDLVTRAIESGHEVCNHTYDHFSAALQSPDEVLRTMERGADAVAEILGSRPRFFRPVKGHVTGAVLNAAAELGHDLALWSVSRGPAESVAIDDVAGVRDNMIATIHEGAVVILHDGIGRSAFEFSGPDDQLIEARDTEVQAMPAVIERYLADGYEFLTVADLIDQSATG